MGQGTAARIDDERRDAHYGRDAGREGELCGCLRAPADVEGLCAPCARELDAWVAAQAAADRAALLTVGPAAFGAPAPRLLPSGTVRCVAWTLRPTWRALVRALRPAAPAPACASCGTRVGACWRVAGRPCCASCLEPRASAVATVPA